ncbi:Exonuclease V [Tolypocladium ophioglossoides CBS 100239]|uniref:Exonuclease V n=1 Tax=Tolypocladium ophioglossoides (strain CBS 100239) TaxID=1163406 RepID=A0A0L0N7J9_TOLOC|nr:Exonuclease V [Tolypocladium ophioglossoides CBS 100239]
MAASETLDSDSDYGYDFTPEEELQLIQLAAEASAGLAQASQSRSFRRETSVAVAISSIPEQTDDLVGDNSALGARHAVAHGLEGYETAVAHERRPGQNTTAVPPFGMPSPVSLHADVTYPDLSRALSSLGDDTLAPTQTTSDADSDAAQDDRSPLQRFRSFPRKPLTVSDLTSGAWCELQYWYTLTRLPGGRRTRTAAMKGGSNVHQKLEDEVHTTVEIDVMSKEDGFALRLWNLIQGLRTLREMGLTRELEVWGMVDGNLVNGVIDGVSYENPNPEFEEELSSQESQQDSKQSALTDYFPPKKRSHGWPPRPKIYLTDVKTRGSLAPVSKALLRPAKIQLLLYHKFLSDMAAGKLDFVRVFRRYGLDADDQFSDGFLAQIGDLHEEVFYDAPSSPAEMPNGPSNAKVGESTRDSNLSDLGVPQFLVGDELVKYQTLRELLPLVRREIKLTFPEGKDSLGHMLRVQYVHREDGRELDVHDFPVSRQALEAYLKRYMGWWRGERQAKGVDIEEAFKCRTCEFASDCSWRQSMDEDRLQKVQRRMSAARQASGP